jgi:RNA polymerase sigma factor (sigma-70 family)
MSTGLKPRQITVVFFAQYRLLELIQLSIEAVQHSMLYDYNKEAPVSTTGSLTKAATALQMNNRTVRNSARMTTATLDAGTPDGAAHVMDLIAQNKDKEAFKVLFEHYAPRVKGYMLKLGTENSLADELAQETLLTVWRKAQQFDRSKASPSTWIFTIARNLRIDAFRKLNRPELDPNDPALIPEAEEPADERVDRIERADIVVSALKDLNPEQAEVVRMSFYEDKSHSVIAEELGVPLGTVKSRLRLAFGRIRKTLGDELE